MSLRSLVFGAVLSLAAVSASAEIVIHDAYARSASPQAKSGAAFMLIMNYGDTDDRLIAAHFEAAQRTELHTHIMEDGVARMVKVEDGFVVPASGIAVLERGAGHVMLMGLTAPLVQGETVTLTLVFEQAGEISVDVLVDRDRTPKNVGHENTDHSAHN